ncbi:MAG TPA: DinB family protein, partial [Longimicrobium sp.]|nr:DinB family protein [Longimicrobium sp.]
HYLRRQMEEAAALARGLSAEQAAHRYAEGKWSIKQVLGHVIDAERIFAYRLLRIGRGDATPLPGFDENPYVDAANFDARTAADLAAELEHVRQSTLDLLRHLDDGALARRGTASGFEVSARALAWIIAGHMHHHLALIRERYLTSPAPVPAA